MKKVQILQGLNLESEISLIKINIKETEEVRKFLELLRSFHPIFIKEYKFEGDTLNIKSKITSLWRELGELLVKLGEKEISYEGAKKLATEEIIKERVLSMSTIPLLYAAHNLGIETTPTLLIEERVKYTKGFNRHFTIGCGKGSGIIYSISSSGDSKIAQSIQKDKWSSNLMIQRLGLPIPKWQVIDNISDLEDIWSEYQKPVVIKPTGLVGGHGVVVGIKTIEDAKKAYKFAKDACSSKVGKDWQQKVMIQEQIQGEDYRLLVINGELEVATKRIPAYVEGDGKSTIEQLINKTNQDPRRDVNNPSHTLKPIIIDEPLLNYLSEQDISLKYIPEKHQKVYVRKVASMSQGGITEDVTEKVGPEIKRIVESIASSIHAFTLGVDVMCLDISKPLTKENGAILEYNTMPEAYLNIFPVIGVSRENILDKYIKSLTSNNNCKKIVVIGNPGVDIPTYLRQKSIFGSYLKSSDRIGEYKDGEIRIDGLDINKNLEKWQAIEALKVNASLDGIVIHHRDYEELSENGLSFDKIDMLIIEKRLTKSKEFSILRKYLFKRYINKIKAI